MHEFDLWGSSLSAAEFWGLSLMVVNNLVYQ